MQALTTHSEVPSDEIRSFIAALVLAGCGKKKAEEAPRAADAGRDR